MTCGSMIAVITGTVKIYNTIKHNNTFYSIDGFTFIYISNPNKKDNDIIPDRQYSCYESLLVEVDTHCQDVIIGVDDRRR